MKLLESLYSLDMRTRLNYNEETRTLYIDLHGVSVTSPDTIADIMGTIDNFFHQGTCMFVFVCIFEHIQTT
jgi:hypothetical protein